MTVTTAKPARRTARKTPVESAAPAEEFQPEYLMVDPATLVIGVNIRKNVKLDRKDKKTAEFIASVKEHGVTEDITVYRDQDGDDPQALIVWRGQRRTKAAIMTGRPLVPVRTRPRPTTAERIIQQMEENDKRAEMDRLEVIEAYRQLEMEGLSVNQIHKATSHAKPEIITGLTVAKSETATREAELNPSLTLRHAALIAEFDDNPDHVRFLRSNGPYHYEHNAEILRSLRAEAAAIRAAVEALTTAGVTVIEMPEMDSTIVPLDLLRQDGEPITVAAHAGCPGHAAHLDPEDQEPVYVCTDSQRYGHEDVTPVIEITRNGITAGVRAAELDAAERAARSVKLKDTIKCNKAWPPAAIVRRRWLSDFIGRANGPKDGSAFVLEALASCDQALTKALEDGHKLALEKLGAPGKSNTTARRAASASMTALMNKRPTPANAQKLTLALILCAYESATSKNSWRANDAGTRRYLRFLESHGYQLSAVERRACGESAEESEQDAKTPAQAGGSTQDELSAPETEAAAA